MTLQFLIGKKNTIGPERNFVNLPHIPFLWEGERHSRKETSGGTEQILAWVWTQKKSVLGVSPQSSRLSQTQSEEAQQGGLLRKDLTGVK